MPVVKRLRHRLGIILPSRNRQGHLLSKNTRRLIQDAVAEWFGRVFAGSTEDRTQIRTRLRGRWGKGVGLTVEEVEEVWAYCATAEFRRHKRDLIRLAEQVAHDADQEAIAILIDGTMELVVRKETS